MMEQVRNTDTLHTLFSFLLINLYNFIAKRNTVILLLIKDNRMS